MFSDVGVRNEILASLEPSSPIIHPLYQRPSLCLNLHFDPTENSCGSNDSGSTSSGSVGSTATSGVWDVSS
uniref:Uncharacterized protein n=1 Tax=Arundo donax TaxID=35708 RepID=A0A0A9E6W6_ARUDO